MRLSAGALAVSTAKCLEHLRQIGAIEIKGPLGHELCSDVIYTYTYALLGAHIAKRLRWYNIRGKVAPDGLLLAASNLKRTDDDPTRERPTTPR